MEERTVFLKYLASTSRHPLMVEVERAEGCYLYGRDGNKYLDLISGISVANAGHRHPAVVKAINEQTDRYLHVMAYGEYIQSPVNRYAKNLVGHLPPSLNNVYFVNSGTEANEAAIKLAKRHTGRTEIVSFKKSYHGNTHGSLSISGNEHKKNAFRPMLPDVRFINFNSPKDIQQISERTAAVIVEPVMGDAGVIIPKDGFLQRLKERCLSVGALLIFDEVQTGMGRTGKLFAFEHFDVVPDILTLAKALGGGLPLGAFISNKDIMEDLCHDPMLGHITTFGGNPVCCAAGNASFEVIINNLPDVEMKGQLFEKLLHPNKMKEIRRIGLMMALEFDSEEIVQKIVKKGIHEGIITYYFLSNPNSFRLAPPLTITEDEIKRGCAIINDICEKL